MNKENQYFSKFSTFAKSSSHFKTIQPQQRSKTTVNSNYARNKTRNLLKPRPRPPLVPKGQPKGQTYVQIQTALPYHPDTDFEFYSDSTIDIQINGSKGIALLDSGAHMSLIDRNLVAKLIPNFKMLMAKYKPRFQGIISVTGERSPILGVLPLTIKIKNFVFEHYTYVVPKLGTQLILGRDFLQANNCTLDFESNTLRSTLINKLYTPSVILIPPRSITTFGVKMYGPHRWSPNGLIMQVSKMDIKPGVHVSPSFSRNENGYITTQVHNDTDQMVHLSLGIHISYARPCSSDLTALKVSVPPGAESSDLPAFPKEADSRYGSSLATAADTSTSSADHIKIPSDTILSNAGQIKLRQILEEKQKAFVGKDGKIGTCSIFS